MFYEISAVLYYQTFRYHTSDSYYRRELLICRHWFCCLHWFHEEMWKSGFTDDFWWPWEADIQSGTRCLVTITLATGVLSKNFLKLIRGVLKILMTINCKGNKEWNIWGDVTIPHQLLNSASLFSLYSHVVISSLYGWAKKWPQLYVKRTSRRALTKEFRTKALLALLGMKY